MTKELEELEAKRLEAATSELKARAAVWAALRKLAEIGIDALRAELAKKDR